MSGKRKFVHYASVKEILSVCAHCTRRKMFSLGAVQVEMYPPSFQGGKCVDCVHSRSKMRPLGTFQEKSIYYVPSRSKMYQLCPFHEENVASHVCAFYEVCVCQECIVSISLQGGKCVHFVPFRRKCPQSTSQ